MLLVSDIPKQVFVYLHTKILDLLMCLCHVSIVCTYIITGYVLDSMWLFDWSQREISLFLFMITLIYVFFAIVMWTTHLSKSVETVIVYYFNKKQKRQKRLCLIRSIQPLLILIPYQS